MPSLSYSELLSIRLYNNGVLNKFKNTETCVYSLIGIQCQYQNYAMISLINRLSCELNAYENDKLIKSWGQRTTLHIYHKKDYNIISGLYKNIDNWVYKYLKQLGIDYKVYLDSIKDFFELNPKIRLSKNELQSIIPNEKSKEIMEWSGLLILATYHKIIYGVINEFDKKIYRKNNIKSNNESIQSIIKRYFKFYGPATKEDFLHWSGLKLYNIEEELEIYFSTAKSIEIENKIYYYEKIPNLKEKKLDYPVILGKFDPLLISYKDKNWILNNNSSTIIWKKAGQVEGTIIIENGLVGTWHYIIKVNKLIFKVNLINKISKKEKEKIESKFLKLNNVFFNKEYIVDFEGEQV